LLRRCCRDYDGNLIVSNGSEMQRGFVEVGCDL
jgi:hypothetical protein